jgi:hypothetical protein
MAVQIQLRSDTSSNWSLVNPTLALGEFGWDITAKLFKVGDGLTLWNDLDYVLTGNAALPPNELRSDYQYPYSYCGVAVDGTSDSTPIWTITRIEVLTNGTILTTTATNVAWTNRTSAIYS